MEKEEKYEEVSEMSRLKVLAEKSGKTVEEFIGLLEEKQSATEDNIAKSNQSIGSQSSSDQGYFDPAGSEFLKGLWGK